MGVVPFSRPYLLSPQTHLLFGRGSVGYTDGKTATLRSLAFGRSTPLSVTRQLVIFFALAYAFSWLVEGWMLVAHAGIQLVILASCGPTVAAMVTNRLAHGSYRAFRLNVSW